MIEQAVISSFPASWRRERLGNLTWVRARLGWKGLTADEYVDSGIPMLATPNIKGAHIDFASANRITAQRYEESPEIQLRVGDVLLTKDGSTIGIANIVRSLPEPATVNGSIAVMTPNERLHSAFLLWLLQANEYQALMRSRQDGMGVPHLFQSDIRRIPVALPSMREQRTIADYLDQETAQIDAFIAKSEELITLLRERRAASIDHAFKQLDAQSTRLKHRAAIQTGVTLGGDGDPADPEWPYLRVANVQVGRVDVEEVKTIRVPAARARQSMLSVGDVLMTEGGDRDKLGRGALWSGDVAPMLHQNHVFAVKVGPNLNARFLMRWLDASPSREYFDATAVQTTNLASTNKTLVGNLPLPSCSVEAQLTLVAELDSRLKKIDDAIAVGEQSVKLARERRAALISAAVTGKIDVGVAV